jgi:hypothetical protein
MAGRKLPVGLLLWIALAALVILLLKYLPLTRPA